MKFFDSRQTGYRQTLQQLMPYLSNQTLNILLQSIDADLTSPLKVDASNPSSLIISVGPAIVVNSESFRNKSISFINNVIPSFTGGTITFPSSSGGNITASTGGTFLLTLPSNDYVQILLSLDQSGNLDVVIGTPNAVESSAEVPAPANNTLPFAYVTLFNNAGTIQNVSQSNIFQLSGSGGGSSGGSGGGVAQEVALSASTTSIAVTFPTPLDGTTYSVIAQLVNKTDIDPQFQPITITNKLNTGFTATWNSPLASANYLLDYIVGPGVVEQVGEQVLSSGNITTTVTIPIPLPSTSYVVTAELVNLVDSDPQFQPITVVAKTTNSFGLSWNMPINTNNYRIAWQVASYQ